MLTHRDLNRALLARQLLLERAVLDVPDAVRRIVALQAQDPASPYLALAARVAGFDPADLDAAYRDGQVVRATLMRITMHAVPAEDYAPMHAAMRRSLRASRVFDRRFAEAGLPAERVDALVPRVLALAAQPAGVPEITALLAAEGGEHPRVWWAMRTFAPLVHVPDGTPWSFGRSRAYRAAAHTWPEDRVDEAAVHLARRYLAGFGPAGEADLAQFTMLTRPVVRAALASLADEVVHLHGPDGRPLVDLPDAPRPDAAVPAPPRLLPMWDSTMLAHADRRRILPEPHRPAVVRRNGDCLPTVLVDGEVAGVWRLTDVGVEVTAFRPLPDDTWAALADEAAGVVDLLAPRDPAVYRRHHHWYPDLPAAQVVTLPA